MPRPHLEPRGRVTRPARRAWAAGLALVLALAVCSLWVAPAIRVHRVAFPSLSGTNVLHYTEVKLGRWAQVEVFYQPASIGYWAGSEFRLTTTAGGTRLCRLGLEGWARPRARTGSLIDPVCTCRRPLVHNDRPAGCLEHLGLWPGP